MEGGGGRVGGVNSRTLSSHLVTTLGNTVPAKHANWRAECRAATNMFCQAARASIEGPHKGTQSITDKAPTRAFS